MVLYRSAGIGLGDSSLVNVNVFKTSDGGKTWSLVNAIPTEATTTEASINVYFLSSSDMWFISASSARAVREHRALH